MGEFYSKLSQGSLVLGGQTGPHFQLLAGAAQPQESKKPHCLPRGGPSEGKQRQRKEHLQRFFLLPSPSLATTVHD